MSVLSVQTLLSLSLQEVRELVTVSQPSVDEKGTIFLYPNHVLIAQPVFAQAPLGI